MDKTVYIVHAIDTEGPIYESLSATFERLNEILGIKLSPNEDNLELLRNKELDLGGKEEIAASFVSKDKLDYNDSWHKIDIMLSKIMSEEFRNTLKDSFGGGWIYNWFCLDLVGFTSNPRGKDIGFHCIYDRYLDYITKYNSSQDSLQFHFHPMTIYKEAHKFSTSFVNSSYLYEILSRKIIERDFFPSSFRPGFHTERPDSNWFLEQWIPFDCANQAMDDMSEKENFDNLKNGRLGDWRGSPSDWSIYNPDLYDYRKKGNLNRFISRCLNMNARHSNLSQNEVNKAFERANIGEPTLMAFTNHDFRDMEPEIEAVINKIRKASYKFPDVSFKFCRVDEAFRYVIFGNEFEKLELDVKLYNENNKVRLSIKTLQSEVFGPQPFLAIKTKGNRFIHDNLDFGTDGKSWYYVFDDHTVIPSDIDTIGVAANNIYGDTFLKKIRINYE